MDLTAREIMTGAPESVHTEQTILDAARMMRDLDVGSLPICGDDGRLHGVLTDRDIVVQCVAGGADPATAKVAEISDGRPVTVGADESVQDALRQMTLHGVRRLPVVAGHELVGILTQADVARNLPPEDAGRLLESISKSSSNS